MFHSDSDLLSLIGCQAKVCSQEMTQEERGGRTDKGKDKEDRGGEEREGRIGREMEQKQELQVSCL